MVIRSYRRVFDLERRIYRLDRFRLNPSGIPVRGVVYFLALVALALVLGRLPLARLLARVLPLYVRAFALPAALAALLAVVRIEGRPFHLAVRAMLRSGARPARIVGLRRRASSRARGAGCAWRPQPLLMVPDGSDARARRMSYRGPGALLIAVAHERRARRGPLVALGLRPHLVLRELRGVSRPPCGEVVVLARGGRLGVD